MKAGPIIGIADIHARAFAHSLEAAQDLNGLRVIGLILT
jgi:hypothetical protein